MDHIFNKQNKPHLRVPSSCNQQIVLLERKLFYSTVLVQFDLVITPSKALTIETWYHHTNQNCQLAATLLIYNFYAKHTCSSNKTSHCNPDTRLESTSIDDLSEEGEILFEEGKERGRDVVIDGQSRVSRKLSWQEVGEWGGWKGGRRMGISS